jgi:hypothetical protein
MGEMGELCSLCTAVRLLSFRQDIKEDQEALGTIMYNELRLHSW